MMQIFAGGDSNAVHDIVTGHKQRERGTYGPRAAFISQSRVMTQNALKFGLRLGMRARPRRAAAAVVPSPRRLVTAARTKTSAPADRIKARNCRGRPRP
ncbi:hypothetical protein EVAR_39252_1 [Eumeta japonica]|uniref:Uncharacterized protein n=1 Tax=Eumeta variegata TaxID=151549 RepID=A0A4C1XYF8_EUMVA|nr:hypothetical protein EVAR_39252_1 [Eumeta japonica]